MTTLTPAPTAADPLAALMAGIALHRLNSERLGHEAKADAIAAYERTAQLAVSMGQGARVCKRPLTIFSAAEVLDMAHTLGLALDKCAAGVAGYGKA